MVEHFVHTEGVVGSNPIPTTIYSLRLSRMEMRCVLKRQLHASVEMLRQSVENCPDEVWLSGEHPRNYWRIFYHAAAFAHLYLYDNLESWAKWPKHDLSRTYLEGDVPISEPYSRAEALEFVDLIQSEIDDRIDAMDLDAPSCGFTWYPKVSRFELIILSMRHLHGHLGQLNEILIADGRDIKWLGQLNSAN